MGSTNGTLDHELKARPGSMVLCFSLHSVIWVQVKSRKKVDLIRLRIFQGRMIDRRWGTKELKAYTRKL